MKYRVTVHEPIYSACVATDWVAVCEVTDAQAYGASPEEAIDNLYEQQGWNDFDGQDRESYSDDQDRESYMVTK